MTFEDTQLLLSTLLVPWLGDVTSEALVATVIPTDAFRFITSACRYSLGLPPNSPLNLRPPSMHETMAAEQSPSGHRVASASSEHATPDASTLITPGPEGKRAAESEPRTLGGLIDESADGPSNTSALSREAEAARPYLPFGLAWAADCASLAYARKTAATSGVGDMHGGQRGHKRTRSTHEKLAGTYICASLTSQF